jgi:hypothetical protein
MERLWHYGLELRTRTMPMISGFPAHDAVDIGGGVLVQELIVFVIAPRPDTVAMWGDITIEGEARLADGRFAITKLVVEGPSVTGALLRKIPVQVILRDVVMSTARRAAGPAGQDGFEVSRRPVLPPDVAKHGPTQEALQAVAAIYRLAYVAGDDPTKAVTDTLELARGTAGRWVMKAREAGYLPPTQPRRAGA